MIRNFTNTLYLGYIKNLSYHHQVDISHNLCPDDDRYIQLCLKSISIYFCTKSRFWYSKGREAYYFYWRASSLVSTLCPFGNMMVEFYRAIYFRQFSRGFVKFLPRFILDFYLPVLIGYHVDQRRVHVFVEAAYW